MSLHKLCAKSLPPEQASALVEAGRQRVLGACQPKALYLFGSAARGAMTDQSDLDFLAVFRDLASLKEGRAQYYATPAVDAFPTDIVFVTAEDFNRRARIGGVCMVCVQEGRLLYESIDD